MCMITNLLVPPLVGFFAKYAVLYTAIHNGFYFISIVAILASVVSAAYYLRVVRVIYFDDQPAGAEIQSPEVLSSAHCYVIAVLTLFLVVFSLYPSLILNSTQLMAMSIYGY